MDAKELCFFFFFRIVRSGWGKIETEIARTPVDYQ